jgi:DNA sulfur modification protein DndB
MKLGKIARECRLASEIRSNKDLDEMIQREIQDRVKKEMVPYLLNTTQRFYGALVVAVYGGEPEFSPVRVDEHKLLDDKERSSYGFGLLRFDGSQQYYALDGQHRLKSIQEAIAENPDLAKEEIAVIILKHEETIEGLQRTRRLFSTLNRRAKPTSTGMNIAIDEDDSIAIVTRRLVKENENIKELVLTKSLTTKQIAPGKSSEPYITTLAAFYETNEILLSAYDGGLSIDNNFKQFRPANEELDAYYSFLENIWMRLLEKCPGFDAVLKGKKKPGDIRKRLDADGVSMFDDNGKFVAGGNVFARPIGQYIIADVLKLVGIQGKSIEDAIDAIMTNISMDIDEAPWAGVIWNPTTQRIVGNKSERSLLAAIISYALGLKITQKIRDIKQKYRDAIGNPKAPLLPPINWSGRTTNALSEEEENESGAEGENL